ncbi:MAG: hypothetical protein II695_05215 [Oscillospiraceae bacterium]|nr:hypothetical protein [Oscillospiraceae bacterium]
MNSIAKGAMIVAVCLIAEFGKHLGCLRVIADNMGRTPAPATADVAVQDIPVSGNAAKPPVPMIEGMTDGLFGLGNEHENLADMDEYYSNGIPTAEGGDYIYSHNEVMMSNGKLCTVDLTSEEMEENGGEMTFFGYNYTRSKIEATGGVSHPQSYDSDKREPVSFSVNGPFLLKFDDYNMDGDPDYVLRVSDVNGNGAFYELDYIICDNYTDYGLHPNWSSRTHSDSSFYVWGETDPTIRLRHIDREHFCFITEDEDGKVYTLVADKEFNQRDGSNYASHDKIWTAVYKDGVITADALNLSEYIEEYTNGEAVSRKTEPMAGEVKMMIRRYENGVWHRVDAPETAVFKEKSRMEGRAVINAKLAPGDYKIEFITDEGSSYANVYVGKE